MTDTVGEEETSYRAGGAEGQWRAFPGAVSQGVWEGDSAARGRRRQLLSLGWGGPGAQEGARPRRGCCDHPSSRGGARGGYLAGIPSSQAATLPSGATPSASSWFWFSLVLLF